jgi:hypothetical protein
MAHNQPEITNPVIKNLARKIPGEGRCLVGDDDGRLPSSESTLQLFVMTKLLKPGKKDQGFLI